MRVERSGNNDSNEVVFDSFLSRGPEDFSFDEEDVVGAASSGESSSMVEPFKTSNNSSSSGSRKSRRNLYLGCCAMTLALAGAAVAGFLVATKEDERALNSQYSITGDFCQPGSIKDTREPLLELSLSAGTMNRLVTDQEKKQLEKSVLAGFNDVSGGCTDEYERWMYGAVLVNQTLVNPHVALEADGTGALSHTLTEEFTLLLQFETIISCDNCTEEEAFASEYPSSFSPVNENGGRARALSEGSDLHLSAARVLRYIDFNLRAAMPEIGRITDATILIHPTGGLAHLSRSASYGDDVVSRPENNPWPGLWDSLVTQNCAFARSYLFYHRLTQMLIPSVLPLLL